MCDDGPMASELGIISSNADMCMERTPYIYKFRNVSAIVIIIIDISKGSTYSDAESDPASNRASYIYHIPGTQRDHA